MIYSSKISTQFPNDDFKDIHIDLEPDDMERFINDPKFNMALNQLQKADEELAKEYNRINIEELYPEFNDIDPVFDLVSSGYDHEWYSSNVVFTESGGYFRALIQYHTVRKYWHAEYFIQYAKQDACNWGTPPIYMVSGLDKKTARRYALYWMKYSRKSDVFMLEKYQIDNVLKLEGAEA